MSIYQVSTKNLGTENADSFIRSVSDDFAYYMFVGNYGPYLTESIPTPVDSTSALIDAYSNMIFGKRISDSDLNIMVKRYNWQSNTVYDMYEDTDAQLKDKKYYVLVQEGELYKVYKCLFNNNDGPSLVEPFGVDTDILEIPIDGYVWKYMYSFDLFTALRFLTDTHMPVLEDLSVKNASIAGSIDVIKINYGGAGYSNYTVGSFREASDLIIDSDPYSYGLDGNASLIDKFYNNCIIKITSGSATGEYRTIENYEIRNGRRIITVDKPFINTILRTDTYEIYPRVFLSDVKGTVVTECIARALIGGTSNTITKIEVLNPGQGYRSAKAELRPDDSVGIDPLFLAELTPIIPPPGGHGYDVKNELNGSFVGISISFIGNNSPLTVRGINDYSSIGILKDPLYANVRVFVDSSTTEGQFVRFEDLYRFKQIKLSGNVSFNSTNTFIYSTESEINKSLRIGDEILIKSETDKFISKVDAIIDDSTFTIEDQPNFEQSNCSLYLVETQYFGQITDVELNYLDLTGVNVRAFDRSNYLLGDSSIAITKVDDTVNDYILINGRGGDLFSGFNQLTKLYGEFRSDVPFILDETIAQDPNDPNSSKAKLYKYENSVELNKDVLYASDVSNTFVTTIDGGSGIITGLSSNAYFISQYKYNGDLISDSGEILYLENINPINRSTTRSETIKLILRF